MANSLSYPAAPPDPLAVAGLQRSSALSRILHFEHTMHRRFGVIRPQRYQRQYMYYTGQNLPPDNIEQPLGINYYRVICDRHTSYLWGQWHENILEYKAEPRDPNVPEDATSAAMSTYFSDLLDQNHKNALLWDGSLNASVYGDGVLRLRWDAIERRVVIESLLPEWVHFRWDVADMNTLTEVILSYPIDRLDAQEKYGTAGNKAINYNLVNPEYLPGFGIFWEHWTPTTWRRWIDDVCIYEGPNPYMRKDQAGNTYPGILPFIHVPNLRVGGEFFGFGDAEMIQLLQDELNRRLADMGDAVNNHAHPIITFTDYNGDIEELVVGPDAAWDMGRSSNGSRPTAEYLQWKGTPPSVMEYIAQLKEMLNDTANMPDVAFGRMRSGGGGGGSGRGPSGIALQMALMPIVERATQKRIYWDLGLKKLAHMASFIHAVMDPDTLPFDFGLWPKYRVKPIFANILPRDRMAKVNENISLLQGGARSTEAVLIDLGTNDVNAELLKIKGDLQYKAKLEAMAGKGANGIPSSSGGKNSDTGSGGNPALPKGA